MAESSFRSRAARAAPHKKAKHRIAKIDALRVAMVDHWIEQACELVADAGLLLLCTMPLDLVIGAGWYGYMYI